MSDFLVVYKAQTCLKKKYETENYNLTSNVTRYLKAHPRSS